MAFFLNPLLKLMFQKKTDGGGGDIPGVEVTAEEINTLDGIDTNTTVQEQINQLHNYADISVKNWSEFLAAVQSSQTVPCRIHFTANITVESSATLNLSNCVVYGHYNRWVVNGHIVTLTGNYAYFYDVLFQGANNSSDSTIAFSFVGLASSTCNFSFENCRFYNFLETSTNAVFVRVDGASGASIHTFLIRCTINGESVLTYGRALTLQKNSGAAVSLKVTELLYAGKPIETRYVSMLNASGNYDMFVADGSCVYIGSRPSNFFQWGDGNLDSVTGILDIAHGGTGADTAKGAEYNLLGSMQEGPSAPLSDTTRFVFSRIVPTSGSGALYWRASSDIWNYIKTKIYGSTLPVPGSVLQLNQDGLVVGIAIQPIANADQQHNGLVTALDVLSNINNLQTQLDTVASLISSQIIDVTTFQNLVPGTATEIIFDFKKNQETTGYTKIGYLDIKSLVEVWRNGTKYLILSEITIAAPASCLGMFSIYSSLTSLQFANFDTSLTNNMSEMFMNCEALTSLDLSVFVTASVTDMSRMFSYCINLTSINVSNFNTSKVTKMNQMFYGDSHLVSLDLSNFDTSSVTTMSSMLSTMTRLQSLDLRSFVVSNVVDMGSMFEDDGALRTIIAQNWTLNSSLQSWDMFSYCEALVGGNGTTYDDNSTDAAYAHIDVAGNPGYFTAPS